MILARFGNKVCSALKEVMGAEYEVSFQEVVKNNGVCLHGIVITKKGSNLSPSIYIDELYREFEEGRPFGAVIYDILCIYKRNAREINMDMEFFTQYECVKNRILYKLIHRENNRKLLREVPYIEWNDLALVFYYIFEDERLGKATILIRNSHLDMWKQDISVLYENAKDNMLRLRPEEMLPIRQVIEEALLKKQSQDSDEDLILPEELQEAMCRESGTVMYMLSNRDRVFGAAALLYSKSLKKLTERLNKNLIILPSSVHEVLLVPDDGVSEKEFFREMVKEVNDTQVEPEERLSYNVYYYDRISDEITIL